MELVLVQLLQMQCLYIPHTNRKIDIAAARRFNVGYERLGTIGCRRASSDAADIIMVAMHY